MKNTLSQSLLFALLCTTQVSVNTFGMERSIPTTHDTRKSTASKLELYLDKLDNIRNCYEKEIYPYQKEDRSPLYEKNTQKLLYEIMHWIQDTASNETQTTIDLNSTSKEGFTLLHCAVDAAANEVTNKENKKSDMFNFTQYLLEHGASPNIQNKYGRTAFFNCMFHTLDRFSNKRHSKIWSEKHGGTTGLETLENLIHLFLAADADPNVASFDGSLCLLAEREYSEVVKQIVQRIDIKASMNNKDKDGLTPACRAAIIFNIEFLRVLANAGADFSIKDADNQTPLDCALEYKDDYWMVRMFGTEHIDNVIKFLLLQERTI